MPLGAISRNNKVLTTDEMNEDEKKEVGLYSQWKRCKVKKYIAMELSEVPEEYRKITYAISQKISDIKLYSESEVARKYIEFLEINMRTPSNTVNRDKKQLKRQFKNDEQAYEESLARRWTNSHIKTVFEEYLEQTDREIPEEYKDIFSRLIELGLKSSKKGYDIEKDIVDQIIEFLNKYNAMPRGAIFKNGIVLNISEMSEDEQEE